jgi:hypothetical protein
MNTNFIVIFSVIILVACLEEKSTQIVSPALREISCTPHPMNCKGMNKVCGLFKPELVQCVRFPCGQTFDSPCLACADNRVGSYINEPCENINTPLVSTNLITTPTNVVQASHVVQQNNVMQHHMRPRHHAFLSGCPLLKHAHLCPKIRTLLCIQIYKPVCAVIFDANGNFQTIKTAPNACEACHNFRVVFYFDGPCKGNAFATHHNDMTHITKTHPNVVVNTPTINTVHQVSEGIDQFTKIK